MDILAIPFHQHLGLTLAKPPGLVELVLRPEHRNHLGTAHASVMVAVAEAGSGLFLQQHAGSVDLEVMPIIRRMEAKFHQTGTERLIARSVTESAALEPFVQQLQLKGKARIEIAMQVMNPTGEPLLTISFEWFVQKRTTGAARAER
jgi:hypothetical protein